MSILSRYLALLVPSGPDSYLKLIGDDAETLDLNQGSYLTLNDATAFILNIGGSGADYLLLIDGVSKLILEDVDAEPPSGVIIFRRRIEGY